VASESIVAVLADLTDDGTTDLAVPGSPGGLHGISVYAGDGTGGFAFAGVTATEFEVRSLQAVDFDLDGRLDFAAEVNEVFLANATSWIAISRGLGPAEFDEPTLFAATGGFNVVFAGDFDGDGRPDLGVHEDLEPRLCVARNATFDLEDARRGGVNAGAGAVVDVLFVNGSAGLGPERRIVVARGEPITVSMAAPPSDPDGPAVFALYKWLVPPTGATVEDLPLGIGRSCLAPPLVPFGFPQPKHVWNNAGRFRKLGEPTHASVAAPSVVLSLPDGLDRSVTWLLQGLIRDRQARNGKGAVTNAIRLDVP
jgi:hypothetical protein